MFYYDSKSNLVKIPVTQKISHWLNTHNVYRTADGRCLNSFRTRGGVTPDISLDQKIQSLQLRNFYTIDEYLFNKSGDYRAILMPFYESIRNDILLRPSDYLSDNFSSIFASFDHLASEHIETRDANSENTIFTPNEIIIIDSERYCESEETELQTLRTNNYQAACWILYHTLIKAALNHPEFDGVNFWPWFQEEERDGYEMCRTITKYKYPIDYLKKVKQKIK